MTQIKVIAVIALMAKIPVMAQILKMAVMGIMAVMVGIAKKRFLDNFDLSKRPGVVTSKMTSTL